MTIMVEQAPYEVVGNMGKVELRLYPPMVVARVNGRGGRGFYNLFQYISGNNRQRSKVAMTAPVFSEAEGTSERIAMTAPVISDTGSMAFVMPEGMTLETAPEPLDPLVVMDEVPSRLVATLRFSGRWTDRAFERRSRELMEVLEKAGARTRGPVFSMVYNPPFTPPFLRRNEVGIEVEQDLSGAVRP